MKVGLQNLTKVFPSRNKKSKEEVIAVNDLTFEIPDGKLVGLLGPSGCGKSTTLYMISGLQKPTSGRIFFGEDDVTNVSTEHRGIGLVFQNYALYPHMTVKQNILFPLQNLKGSEKLSKEKMLEKAYYVAKLVQLEELMERKPSELSGGQQQRVAIARALVKMPKVLLLDEPLSNLDARLRLQTREEIRKIQKETGITTIFVTHDQEEAMTMSDRVVVMQDGIIQQLGTPEDIYNEPVNPFVANFIGETNIVRGTYLHEGLIEFLGVEFAIQGYKFEDGEQVDVVIRPEDWDVVPLDQAKLIGTVTSRIFKGVHYEICAMFGDKEIVIHAYETPNVGDKIGLKVDPYEIHLMKVVEEEVEEEVNE